MYSQDIDAENKNSEKIPLFEYNCFQNGEFTLYCFIESHICLIKKNYNGIKEHNL